MAFEIFRGKRRRKPFLTSDKRFVCRILSRVREKKKDISLISWFRTERTYINLKVFANLLQSLVDIYSLLKAVYRAI